MAFKEFSDANRGRNKTIKLGNDLNEWSDAEWNMVSDRWNLGVKL